MKAGWRVNAGGAAQTGGSEQVNSIRLIITGEAETTGERQEVECQNKSKAWTLTAFNHATKQFSYQYLWLFDKWSCNHIWSLLTGHFFLFVSGICSSFILFQWIVFILLSCKVRRVQLLKVVLFYDSPHPEFNFAKKSRYKNEMKESCHSQQRTF